MALDEEGRERAKVDMTQDGGLTALPIQDIPLEGTQLRSAMTGQNTKPVLLTESEDHEAGLNHAKQGIGGPQSRSEEGRDEERFSIQGSGGSADGPADNPSPGTEENDVTAALATQPCRRGDWDGRCKQAPVHYEVAG